MKAHTLGSFTGFTLGLAALALLGLIFAGAAPVGTAQTGSGLLPPTYDWDDTVPGIQGPTSPLLAGAERRQFRSFVVSIPVLVPLMELQAALPPGFIAIALAAGLIQASHAVYYGFSTLGNPLQLFALGSVFVLATSFMGQAMGAWFRYPETPTLIVLGTSLPQLFLTGFSWPREKPSKL